MSVLARFEVEVLKLMGPPDLSPDAIEGIAREAALVGYEYSGSGYFLTIAHPQLPAKVSTWGEPIVVGHADGVDCGFVLFVGRHEMMIECHTWGPVDVPADFRTKNVRVEVR